jgi:hypothetical protein
MYVLNRRLSPEDAGNYMVNVRNKFGEKANHVRLSMKARQLSYIRARVYSHCRGHKERSSSLADHSALAYEPKCRGMGGGGGGCGVSANEYSCAHEAQINFGDLIPYTTYGSRLY